MANKLSKLAAAAAKYRHTRQARTQGGSSPLAPPPWASQGRALPHPGIYGQRLKSGVVGKNKPALFLKWVFSPFKVVENFLGAERYLFPTFILVFPLYLKSPPPPYLNKQ